MNQPWIYMYSPSRSSLSIPPPSPSHPSGSSQCTSPEHLSHASNLGWWCFTLDSILVSMLFSQNIPPSPSPTESKSLFYTSVPWGFSTAQPMSRDGEGCNLTSHCARAPSFVIHLPCSIAVVQPFSCAWLLETPWTAACQAPLSSTVSQSSLTFMSIESVTLSNHLILWGSLLLLPSIFPSIRVFSN